MNISSVRNRLAAIILIAGITAPAVAQPTASDDEAKKQATVQLEKFEVTGSRIKRTDIETPQPVVTYSSESIKNSGYSSLGQFVQSLPFNTGSSNSVFQGASFTRGAATANPRGLGGNRFLTLVNGRRAPTYALTNSANQSVFDFNSIPIAAIDSIEFLKDGASAIYGSDAITGVLNIKLKKEYTGLSTNLYAGNTLGHDSLVKSGSFLAGGASGKTSAMVVFNYQGGNSSYIRDYSRSRTTDYSFEAPRGINQNSSNNWPANVNFTAAQALAAGLTGGSGLYVLSGGVPTANPAKAQFVRVAAAPNENRYDFAQSYQLSPPFDYYDTYAHLNHEFSDRLSAFAELSYSSHLTLLGFTPSVIASTQNAGTGPTGLLNVPASNPYNPFGIDLTNFLYRTNFGPSRQFDTESTGASFLVGLKGQINSDWSWELGATRGYSEAVTTSRNQIRASDLQAALNGTTRATALNPFGPSDNQALVNSLFTISNSSARSESYGWDFTVSGDISQLPLPGGDVGVAAGAEWRRDKLDTRPDTQAYVGSGGGLPLTGSRIVKSAYVEFSLPVIKLLEVQLAGRHEEYSDFGKTNKPKASVLLRLPENDYVSVLVRGSYSKSFKAPDLGRLYASQTVAFSSNLLQDPLRPQDPPTQMRIVTGGNPNLKPENARVQYIGAVFELSKKVKNPWLKNLSLSVDYFDFLIDDVISTPSSTFILSTRGRELYPNAIIRDNSTENPGPILRLSTVPVNLAKQFYKGYDFELDYGINDTRIGSFKFKAAATYISYIGSDAGTGSGAFNNVGLYNNPRFIGTFGADWRYRDHWSAAVTARYSGQYFNDGYTTAGWGQNPTTTINPSITYRGLWHTDITIGANNVMNQEPPRNGYETLNFDPNTYGNLAAGRVLYISVSKQF
jgi:outer membrane receptor protein involved in Fe transport